MRSPTKLQQLVQTIYSSGCELHVSKTGTVHVRKMGGSTEDVSFALSQQVSRNQEKLWNMIEMPNSEEAYEGRSALFIQALEFMDTKITKKHGEEGVELATRELCRSRNYDALNEAFYGEFGEFRLVLKAYVRVGLRAARGEVEKDELTMEAVG